MSGKSFVVDRPDAVVHDGKFRSADFLDYTGRPHSMDPESVVAFRPEPDYAPPAETA